MTKILQALAGKKTYTIAILFLIATLVPVIWNVAIPEYVWGILSSLGLAAIRLAIQEIKGNTGWKTYVASAVVFLFSVLTAAGVDIPPALMEGVYALFGTLGIVGVRSAIGKLGE
jgi:hypothetical protein